MSTVSATSPALTSLPRWPRVRLGEVCQVVGGSTPRSGVEAFWNGDIVWVTPSDLGQLETDQVGDSARRITQEGYASCGAAIVPPGSVVMSSRAPIGHLAVATTPLCTNQGCKTFVPGPKVDSDFLIYRLKLAVPALQALGSGATFAEISKTQCEAFEIGLPPLTEQKRIAAALREQLGAAARMRAAVEIQLASADSLTESVLAQAFQHITPLAVGTKHDPAPTGWKWILLTDMARLESGHTPSRRHPEWWGGEIPWLALPDIRELDCQVAQDTIENTNPLGIANSSARILPKGTVVLSRTASVGFVAMMGRPMATSQDFVNWVCGPDLDPRFLMYLLRAARAYIRAQSSGAIHKTVYVPTVKAFEVCVPSRSAQVRIASEISLRMTQAASVRRMLEAQAAQIAELPTAMLREAFSGRS